MTKLTKYVITLLSGVLLINIFTWFMWGKTALLQRGYEKIWINSAVPSYQKQYDAHVVFATIPPHPKEIRANGETIKIHDLDTEKLFTTFEQLDTPMVATYSEAKYWNPFAVKATIGYWLVGSDHIEQHDEWLIWIFTTWVPIWKSGNFEPDSF